MKINILIVATGKYIDFLPQLLESADKYFLRCHDVKYCIFTNASEKTIRGLALAHIGRHWRCLKVEHKPWPHATLKRFHFFQQYKDELPKADYFFYIDADTRIMQPIGEEVLGKRTAVQHCGYVDSIDMPFENNIKSMAFVPYNKRFAYYGGGFWGFEANEFWNLVNYAVQAIDFDEENGIVPIWHDESVLNKYLAANPPTVVLDPSYHYPENNPHIYNKWARAGKRYDCKILLLDKNHEEVRG